MKQLPTAILFALLSASVLTAGALAAEKPAPEKGSVLFNSSSLAGATSGKSCASCHPGGKGLENAWKNPDLAGRINACIAATLKGTKLDVNSVDMQSLILYIRTLKK